MNCFKATLGLLFLLAFSYAPLLAQNTGISDVARTPDASAVLDVYSTSKGMLVPRVTQAQRTAITTPATGLLVYQTDGATPGFYYYTGIVWTPIAAGSGSQWTKEPNTNNIYYSTGFVGVGVTNPRNQLVVNNTLEIRRTGTISELLFTNTSFEGDFRIGGDGGDLFWQGGGSRSLQMGSYHATVLSGDRQTDIFPNFLPGNAYLNRGVVVKGSRDVSIPLSIQGYSATHTANLTEWLNSAGTAINVVNSAGNLGLGVTAPAQKLDVSGNFRLTGAFMPNDQPGAVGSILQSNGAGAAPTWVDLSSAANNFNWVLGGNTLTGIKNLGTISNHDLPFITNNTEKMRITTAGNVGIGTAAPISKLHLITPTGSGGLDDDHYFDAYTGTSINSSSVYYRHARGTSASPINLITGDQLLDINGHGYIGGGFAGSSFLRSFYIGNGTTNLSYLSLGTSGVEQMRISAAGYVGIGTTTPVTPLQLATAAGGNLLYLQGGQGGAGSSVGILFKTYGYAEGNSDNPSAQINAIDDGAFSNHITFSNRISGVEGNALTERLRIASSGNVGIGITTPTAKLDVNGNLRVATLATGAASDQIVTVGTNGILNQRTAASIAADAGAITTANNGLTKSGNNVQLGGALVQPTSITGITATNPLSFTSPNNADAAVTIGSTANEGGGVIFGNIAHGVQRGFPGLGTNNNVGLFTTSGNLSLSTNGRTTDEFTLYDNGNVGIGTTFTTTPAERLEVNGNIKINAAATTTPRRLVFATPGGDPDAVIEVRPTGSNEQQEMLLYVGNDDSNNGAGPDRMRMVAEEFRFQSFNTPTSNNLGLAESQTGINTRMIITGIGNVGIGVIAPAQKLDVDGNFRLTGAFMPGGNAGTNGQVLQSTGNTTAPVWVAPGASSNWALGGNNLPATPGIRDLGTTSNHDLPFITNSTEKMRITATGNIGIGTTAPVSPLHISTAAGGSLLYLQSRVGGTGSTAGITFKTYAGNTNPSGQINAIDDGTFSNHLTFSTKIPGVEANALAERVRIASNGNVGIGTATFDGTNPEKLLVNAGTTTSVNAIVAKGNINSYFQTNIQNLSTGNQSSSDIVATANNGTETTNFVNLGINGQNFAYQTGNNITTGGPNDGYLISAGQNFYIANNNTEKDIIFLAGGNVANNNEAMRITSNERVGVGTATPTSTLSVDGSLTMAVRTVAAATNILETDHVVINTGGANAWTLPAAAAANKGRIYRLVNHGTGTITLTQPIVIASGNNQTALTNTSGDNTYEIISDGTTWRRIN